MNAEFVFDDVLYREKHGRVKGKKAWCFGDKDGELSVIVGEDKPVSYKQAVTLAKEKLSLIGYPVYKTVYLLPELTHCDYEARGKLLALKEKQEGGCRVCPRCGGDMRTVLSENAKAHGVKLYICPACGKDEMERSRTSDLLPFSAWAALKWSADSPRGEDEEENGEDLNKPELEEMKKKKGAKKGFLKLGVLLLLFASIVAFRWFVLDRVVVSGESMEDTFSDGDILWAQKIEISSYDRFDIVIIRDGVKHYIKRVVGLPGEMVQIVDGKVCVNGEELATDYGEPMEDAGCAAEPLTLAENEYFLLGDNRNASEDSRIWGGVPVTKIEGSVVFQIFPFWEFGTSNVTFDGKWK